MHDPMTVAFEIKYPWREKPSKWFPEGYRQTAVTIWHVDPESDGSDDSCGWSHVKLDEKAKKLVKEMAKWEEEHPYYFRCPSQVRDPKYRYHQILPGDCAALCLSIYQTAAWRLFRERLTTEQINDALLLGANEGDNLQACFALDPELTEYQRQNKIERAFYCAIRCYLNTRRRWWQHPRWHFRHWKFQVIPLQTFKRWAFSSCARCGRGFSWGYTPVSSSWDSDGPQWFKSEPNIYHHDCHGSGIGSVQAVPL